MELRQAIPAAFFSDGEPSEELESRFRELLAQAQASAPFGDTRRVLKASEREARFEPPDGQIQELVALDSLTMESWLERREGLPCAVSTDNGTARIDFGSNFVSGPSSLLPLLQFVLERRRFRVEEMPGDLSPNSKLVLVRRCVRLKNGAGGCGSSGSSAGAVKELPHSPQNLHLAGFSAAHRGHFAPSFDPHWPQNFMPNGLSNWHFGHLIDTSRLAQGTCRA